MQFLDKILGVFFLLSASFLSGCFSDQNDAPPQKEPDGSGTATTTANPTIDFPLTNATLGRLDLSQCTGFSVGTNVYPTAITPGNPPPGWEPDSSALTSFVLMTGYECNRIHVGPYERGPIHMLWDSHGTANIPPECMANQTGRPVLAVLGVLLVDDVEIASHLQSTYGIPTLFAEFDLKAQVADPFAQRTWSWEVPGEAPSNFTFIDHTMQDPYDRSERLFWPHGEGLGQLDLSYQRNALVITESEGYGFMQPPMLMADAPLGLFRGATRSYTSMSGTGSITLFSDTLCQSPEPFV